MLRSPAYAGDLNIHGSSSFNRAFYNKWLADGFVDYMSSGPDVPDNVEEVLKRVLDRPAPRPPPGSKAYGAAMPEGAESQAELDELLARRPSILAMLHSEGLGEDGDGPGDDLAPLDDEETW